MHFRDKSRGQSALVQCTSLHLNEVFGRTHHWSDTKSFNLTVLGAVLANAVLVGFQVDAVDGSAAKSSLEVMNWCFVVFFIWETGIRINHWSWSYFLQPYNVFDFYLVLLGCVDTMSSIQGKANGTAAFRVSSAARIFRAGRLLKQVSLSKRGLSELRLMLQTMMGASITVFWIMCVLVFFLYMLGVIFVIEFGDDNELRKTFFKAAKYYATVSTSMFSALQLVTMDNWSEGLIRPMVRLAKRADPPEFYNMTVPVIMMVFLMVLRFGLFKVLLGAIVERTLAAKKSDDYARQRDADSEKELIENVIKRTFPAGDYELTLDDFKECISTDSVQHAMAAQVMQERDMEEIFHLLDRDGGGTVSRDEVAKVMPVLLQGGGLAGNKELYVLECDLKYNIKRLEHLAERFELLANAVETVTETVAPLLTYYGGHLEQREIVKKSTSSYIREEELKAKLLRKIDQLKPRLRSSLSPSRPRRASVSSRLSRSAGSMRSRSAQSRRPRGSPASSRRGGSPSRGATPLASPQTPATPLHQFFDVSRRRT